MSRDPSSGLSGSLSCCRHRDPNKIFQTLPPQSVNTSVEQFVNPMDTNDVGLPAMPLGVQMLLPFALGYEVEIQQNTCELHRDSRSDTVAEAAPAKRTRKSMSRRTGQKGHIEQSGR